MYSQRRMSQQNKFLAKIHGYEYGEKEKVTVKSEDSFAFRSPEEYSHLTDEEKKALTEKMRGQHKEWHKSFTEIG